MKRSMASVLTLSVALQTGAPLAFADAPQTGAPRASSLTYTFSSEIPNHGAIDLFHNAYLSRDRVSNSLYLLRNTAIEDLLNTRLALKTLLGGQARTQQISKKNDLNFEVPGGVIELYLLGNLDLLGSTKNRDSARPSYAMASTGGLTERSSIESDTAPEIARAIHPLGDQTGSYDDALRARLLLGLAYISAQITKFDRQIKFIEEDFWNNPTITVEFYDQELEKRYRQAKLDPDLNALEHSVKEQWLSRHGMTDILATLAGHREYLLDRYHLLASEVDGAPLYQQIYKAMQKVGFPAADQAQPLPSPHLPSGTDPIQMPSSFEQALNSALNNLSSSGQNQILSELNAAVNAKIDKALITSLEANTDRLNALTQIMDYDGSRSSPLLELARYPDLWAAATQKYQYLSGIIHLKGARDEIDRFLTRKDTQTKQIRYATYGAGIGLGVASMILSAGTTATAASGAQAAAALLGIPLRTWLVGSAGILGSGAFAAQSTYDYVASEEAAKMSKGLFLGTAAIGTHQGMKDALLMAEGDFRTMIGGLIILGAETKVLTLLSKGRALVQSGGKTLVRLSSEELSGLRSSIAALAERSEKIAPMGRALITVLKSLLGMVAGTDRIVGLEEAITSVAAQMRLAPAVVQARLEENLLIGPLLKSWSARQLSSKILIERELVEAAAMGRPAKDLPTFAKTMFNQQMNNLVTSVVSEYKARGDRFSDEIGDFGIDLAQGAVVTAALVWFGSPTLPEAEQAVFGGAKIRTQGSFWNSGLGDFLKRGSRNFLVGMSVNGSSSLIQEGVKLVKNEPSNDHSPGASARAQHALANTLYGGLFTGVWGTSRYKVFSAVENLLAGIVKNQSTAQILIQSAWTGNNLIGGWSYVTFGKALGVFHSDGSVDALDPNAPEGSHELDPSITGIEIQELGGGFIKVDGDESAAGHLFDFLRGTDTAR